MSDLSTNASPDLSGRERLTWNAAVSWAAQLVSIVVGFLMPRFIHENLGQTTLGIWDFGWALVSYLSLINFSVGANASKFVAQFAPRGEYERLSRIMASANLIQVGIALLLAAGVVVLYHHVLDLFPEGTLEEEPHVREVVLLLGFSLSLQMLTDACRGVITGLHRWDAHNAINTLHSVLAAVGMMIALFTDHGILSLGAVYFIATIIAEIGRYLVCRWACPQLSLAPRLANVQDLRMVLSFGIKNLVILSSAVAMQQTVSILVTARLGPAMLAVFARPTGLVRQVETFIQRFSFMLMPTTSSLYGMGRQAEVYEFTVETSRVAWALAIPPAVYMLTLGPELISAWMGPEYVNVPLIWIVSLGSCYSAANRVGYRILSGADAHGLTSVIGSGIYLSALVAAVVWIGYNGGGILAAATIYVLGDVLFHGVVVPFFLCRTLKANSFVYLWQSGRTAVAIGFVCYGVLSLFKAYSGLSDLTLVLAGAALHGVVVLILYWRFVVSPRLKAKIVAGLFKD
ncbi:MAG: hypothetical protein H6994_06640 [Pseudomonadales bacterium]|nr:hypothetical protein [Pseudomonadales bacterium]